MKHVAYATMNKCNYLIAYYVSLLSTYYIPITRPGTVLIV